MAASNTFMLNTEIRKSHIVIIKFTLIYYLTNCIVFSWVLSWLRNLKLITFIQLNKSASGYQIQQMHAPIFVAEKSSPRMLSNCWNLWLLPLAWSPSTILDIPEAFFSCCLRLLRWKMFPGWQSPLTAFGVEKGAFICSSREQVTSLHIMMLRLGFKKSAQDGTIAILEQ